jgi:hypothetical protein
MIKDCRRIKVFRVQGSGQKESWLRQSRQRRGGERRQHDFISAAAGTAHSRGTGQEKPVRPPDKTHHCFFAAKILLL